jgi:DNA-binding transcriptional ArsR family regulator
MVEHALQLDSIFGSLSDATRRDILKRVAKKELSVSEVAKPYRLSLAAVSKHLKILEKAKLIIKRREGKQQFVKLSPVAIKDAVDYLKRYEEMWNDRFDSLEKYLKNV